MGERPVMKRNPLDVGRFQRIARTFSGDFKLRVDATTFQCKYVPATATIYIPANSDQLSGELQDVVEGRLDHEALHARAEERDRRRRAAGEDVLLPSEAMARLGEDAKRRQLFNVIKDVADEVDGAEEYPGMARHLDAANAYAVGRLREQLDAGTLSPWRQVTCGAILKARGLEADWLPAEAQRLAEMIGPDLEESKGCLDARRQLELVERTWKKLEDLACDKDDEVLGKFIKVALSAIEASDDLGIELLDDVSREAIRYAETARTAHVPLPEALLQDRVEQAEPGSQSDYLRMLGEVQPAVAALRAKLLTMLRSQAADRVEPDKEEGTLDPTQLHRLFGEAQDRAVFCSISPGMVTSAAFLILRDFSSSMRRQRARLEQRACLAVAEALAQLRIATEIVSFSNPFSGMIAGDERLYNRFEPFRYVVFKEFSESYQRAKLRIASPVEYVGGNNSDAEAVMWAARRLALRPEQRRILLVLSDGEPAAYGDYDLLLKATIANVKQIARSGIEPVGIGIMSDSVQRIYPNHASVYDLPELAPELMRVLRRLLVGRGERRVA